MTNKEYRLIIKLNAHEIIYHDDDVQRLKYLIKNVDIAESKQCSIIKINSDLIFMKHIQAVLLLKFNEETNEYESFFIEEGSDD